MLLNIRTLRVILANCGMNLPTPLLIGAFALIKVGLSIRPIDDIVVVLKNKLTTV